MMTPEELAGKIDLSLLKPTSTKGEVEALVRGAQKFPFATVCVPPCHAGFAARLSIKDGGSGTKISTVVGFPLGYTTTSIKTNEAKKAIEEGAEEIDMVMNISMLKSGEFSYVEDDISAVVTAVPHALVKVIIEACYLTDEEKSRAVDMLIGSGADFVKTSTGFGPGGAAAGDVRLIKERAAGRIKIKAAGGIKSLEEALKMIEAGADRIGTSAGVEIVEGFLRGVD
ncbi:MAG: deoxyribose-phosphate aldolase [Thermodesulfobacteriota bacterium]